MASRLLTKDVTSLRRLLANVQAAEDFHPIPKRHEREAWERIAPTARKHFIKMAEAQRSEWKPLTAGLFLEYERTGNRSTYEKESRRRREKLKHLVIAECMEASGRFTDDIADGIWLVCEESFWGYPAHLNAQKAGTGLPDIAEPIVDLFAADTASLLGWTLYLMEAELNHVSRRLPERIYFEIDRRILTPAFERNDFTWMGLDGRVTNNWCTWICSNWLALSLMVDRDPNRRLHSIVKILFCLDNFLSHYPEDGGCDEGPGYWEYAGGSLFDCLELLYRASRETFNGFEIPLVREIGRYIVRAHIYNDWYANFADASAKLRVNGDLIYRFGHFIDDDHMKALGAFAAFANGVDGIPSGNIGRLLPAIFNLDHLRKAARFQPLLRDVWLPNIQFVAARMKHGSPEGLYFAAKGGHNAESHNHNDVGSFIVYSDGSPVLIDVGVESYTRRTFSAERYEIWTMQSSYHNCPTINGVMQAPGPQFAASDVYYNTSDSSVEFCLNIAKAYPIEANIRNWRRLLRLYRTEKVLVISDEFTLERPTSGVGISFMTAFSAPALISQDEVLLPVSASNVVSMMFDSQILTIDIEKLAVKDERLLATWGNAIYRILLTAKKPVLEGKWDIIIRRKNAAYAVDDDPSGKL